MQRRGSGSASCSTDAEFLRELQYGCSVKIDRVSSSTDATFAQWLVENMSGINSVEGNVTKQDDASIGCIVRAHSSLRRSVDF